MKYKNAFLNNKWQNEDILNFKKENVGNLNTFQEKFIILYNNGYKIWKKSKKLKIHTEENNNHQNQIIYTYIAIHLFENFFFWNFFHRYKASSMRKQNGRNLSTAIYNVAVHDLTIRLSKFKMAVKSSREEQVIH